MLSSADKGEQYLVPNCFIWVSPQPRISWVIPDALDLKLQLAFCCALRCKHLLHLTLNVSNFKMKSKLCYEVSDLLNVVLSWKSRVLHISVNHAFDSGPQNTRLQYRFAIALLFRVVDANCLTRMAAYLNLLLILFLFCLSSRIKRHTLELNHEVFSVFSLCPFW